MNDSAYYKYCFAPLGTGCGVLSLPLLLAVDKQVCVSAVPTTVDVQPLSVLYEENSLTTRALEVNVNLFFYD